jgi:hypothetical protein
MTLEEAVRRIDQAAEEKLTELNLSGLDLKKLPSEVVKYTHLKGLLLGITILPPRIRRQNI